MLSRHLTVLRFGSAWPYIGQNPLMPAWQICFPGYEHDFLNWRGNVLPGTFQVRHVRHLVAFITICSLLFRTDLPEKRISESGLAQGWFLKKGRDEVMGLAWRSASGGFQAREVHCRRAKVFRYHSGI